MEMRRSVMARPCLSRRRAKTEPCASGCMISGMGAAMAIFPSVLDAAENVRTPLDKETIPEPGVSPAQNVGSRAQLLNSVHPRLRLFPIKAHTTATRNAIAQ